MPQEWLFGSGDEPRDELAKQGLRDVAASGVPDLTSEDVWGEAFPFAKRHEKWMGAVMAWGASVGLIARTGTTRKSKWPLNHNRPQEVWRVL